ncbi:Hypp3174 [Branchiostoma lanceolatum]|uniref:Hypp3174 protein n=1 Tax=Branchiostoma lanceolatum TaxID=7740 RepID=A0A8J9ZXI0_BRALA|nr:Hypp3174 [Branchiostoma lanceolatum]
MRVSVILIINVYENYTLYKVLVCFLSKCKENKMAWWPGLVSLLLFLAGSHLLVFGDDTKFLPEKVRWVRFIVTVNDTWDPDGCIATIATGKLIPNKKYNETEQITVGSCDHGPLVYTVAPGQAPNKMAVDLTFHSSVVLDASPPTCRIPWNGTYVTPLPNTDPLRNSPSQAASPWTHGKAIT